MIYVSFFVIFEHVTSKTSAIRPIKRVYTDVAISELRERTAGEPSVCLVYFLYAQHCMISTGIACMVGDVFWRHKIYIDCYL